MFISTAFASASSIVKNDEMIHYFGEKPEMPADAI